MTEEVLVIATELLNDLLDFSGIKEIPLDVIKERLREHATFLPRLHAEGDESHRQVIPYIVLKNGEDFILLKRTEKQGEKRLHNKFALGIGGHVNSTDGNLEDAWRTFERGLWREFNEEVDAEPKALTYLGVINDLSSPVSRVHLGILYLAEVEFRKLREEDMFEIFTVSWDELSAYKGKMEGWSTLTTEYLLKFLKPLQR